MELDFEKGRGLIPVEDAPSERMSMSLLVSAAHLDDRVILESMVALAEERRVSRADALAALVAEKVLSLGIPKGSRVVLPTSGIIDRGMANTSQADVTLMALRGALEEAATPSRIVQAGLELGDRATHCAAGFWGNRNLGRVMDKDQRTDYASSMASLGYRSALNAAQRQRESTRARAMSLTVPEIIRRFGHIVRILSSFHEEELEAVAGSGSGLLC